MSKIVVVLTIVLEAVVLLTGCLSTSNTDPETYKADKRLKTDAYSFDYSSYMSNCTLHRSLADTACSLLTKTRESAAACKFEMELQCALAYDTNLYYIYVNIYGYNYKTKLAKLGTYVDKLLKESGNYSSSATHIRLEDLEKFEEYAINIDAQVALKDPDRLNDTIDELSNLKNMKFYNLKLLDYTYNSFMKTLMLLAEAKQSFDEEYKNEKHSDDDTQLSDALDKNIEVISQQLAILFKTISSYRSDLEVINKKIRELDDLKMHMSHD